MLNEEVLKLYEKLPDRFIKTKFEFIDEEGYIWLGANCVGRVADISPIAEQVADVE